MNNERQLVRSLRRVLERIGRAHRLDSEGFEHEIEAMAREVQQLPRDGLLAALDLAIGTSKKRQKDAIFVLAELADVPGVAERFVEELRNPDLEIRRHAIAAIGINRWIRFAPLLNDIILGDPDEYCRMEAVNVAGELRQDVNFDAILALARRGDSDVTSALRDFGREEGRPYLQAILHAPTEDRPRWLRAGDFTSLEKESERCQWSSQRCEKVIAAWGLARLGDTEGLGFLERMLYDPDYRGNNFLFTGQSFRAAQAIGDLFDISFEWNRDDLERVRDWWEENKEHVVWNKNLRRWSVGKLPR